MFLVRQERAILKNKLDSYRQELKEALRQLRAKKRAKKMKKGKRIMDLAAGPRDEVPAYDS